jgi:hypothetical protein
MHQTQWLVPEFRQALIHTARDTERRRAGPEPALRLRLRKKDCSETKGRDLMTFRQAISRALVAFMALGFVQVIAGVLVPMPMAVAQHFPPCLTLSNALATPV